MQQPLARHNVMATFASADDARTALTMLERKGIEAGDIELAGPGAETEVPLTNDELRDADMRSTGTMVRRTAVGVAIGAVLGALVGFVIAVIVSDSTGPIVAATLGGFVAGAPLGFLYAGFTGLPVNEQWGDTFLTEGGETTVLVHSDERETADVAVDVLRAAPARRIVTCGPDGRVQPVS